MATSQIDSVNPATEEVIRSYEPHSTDEVDRILDGSAEAFESWKERPIEERQMLVQEAGEVLRDRTDEYAETITHEMGKPVSEARSEVEKCAWVCDYYAENAAEHLQKERVGTEPE
ncbi:MAG: aldehyde dehydrogenase family protein, partial [Halobacteria archaeon]|nr:aldehyde dehydrogenase family protein [Halobacteria archaeon]